MCFYECVGLVNYMEQSFTKGSKDRKVAVFQNKIILISSGLPEVLLKVTNNIQSAEALLCDGTSA